MAVPDDSAIGQTLAAEGYFTKAAQGDQRAASLFARLAAFRLNPSGNPSGWGALRKGGGTQVDGYAEDAIVFGNNPADVMNVADTVVGAGAAGASLPSRWDAKPRRTSDTWERPRALTDAELAYLRDGAALPGPTPGPPSNMVPYRPHPQDESTSDVIGRTIEADYKRAGRPGLDYQSVRWTRRILQDHLMGDGPPPGGRFLTLDESVAKHRASWCAILGIPVQ